MKMGKKNNNIINNDMIKVNRTPLNYHYYL